MNEDQVIEQLDQRLNEEGKPFGIRFSMSPRWREDGEWTQFYVTVEDNGKRIAARQILSEVEEKVTQDWGREIIVMPMAA